MAEVNLEFIARCYPGDSFLASPVFIDIRLTGWGVVLPQDRTSASRRKELETFLAKIK